MPSPVEVLRDGPVAQVWLNRPEVRNAFDASTIMAITAAFSELAQDVSLRVVMLAARGSVFSAGADLNWMRDAADQSWADNHRDAARLAHMLWTIASCPVPVVARVQGDCHGGGVGLVACSDVVIASHDAGFCLSEARLGLIPATISPYVINAIGERAARRYMVTAERFDAERAMQRGLVHEACPSEQLDHVVKAVIERIVANGPMAVRASKQLIKDIGRLPLSGDLRDLTARRIADVRASEEGREGMRAFLSRTRPAWQADHKGTKTGEAND
jgi:methylglutaconyl-CoA hydratase